MLLTVYNKVRSLFDQCLKWFGGEKFQDGVISATVMHC